MQRRQDNGGSGWTARSEDRTRAAVGGQHVASELCMVSKTGTGTRGWWEKYVVFY